jgi:trypsin-like peptidase
LGRAERVRAVIATLLSFTGTQMVEVVGLTSNVLKRVVRIGIGDVSGTAFTIEVDGRQYLVTAKHVIATLTGLHGTINVFGDGGGHLCQISVLRCDDPIDIAILVPRTLQTVTFDLPVDSAGMILGQDVYFVGFPYADPVLTTTTAASETIGFVRKAVWSAQERKNNATRLYLDGVNNSGFSGAPVVYLEQGKPGLAFKVAGVVSGYRAELTEVMKLEPIAAAQITREDRAANRILDMADGTHRKLVGTGQIVSGNTGIVVAYDIGHAVDLVRKSNIKVPE